jgi:hypothetical protein
MAAIMRDTLIALQTSLGAWMIEAELAQLISPGHRIASKHILRT